jgi:hypothetical protein
MIAMLQLYVAVVALSLESVTSTDIGKKSRLGESGVPVIAPVFGFNTRFEGTELPADSSQ